MGQRLTCAFVLLLGLWAFYPRGLTVEETDSGLSSLQGTVFYQGIPFTGTVVCRFPNGSLARSLGYAQGLRDGLSKAWYGDGRLESLRLFRQGLRQGTHESWWPDGRRRFRHRFRDDVPQGLSEDWYPSGQLYQAMHYQGGHESGLQTIYHSDGRIESNYEVIDGQRFGLVNSRGCHGGTLARAASRQ